MNDPLPHHVMKTYSDPLSSKKPSLASKPRPRRSAKRTSYGLLSRMTGASRPVPDAFLWDTTDPAAAEAGKTSTSPLTPTEKNVVNAFSEAGHRRRVRDELSLFCSDTSFTALVRIHKASSWARRLGWMLVVVSMFSWLTVQCYWLLDKYFSYPMEVKLDMVAARQLEFPSVTVCNLNPITQSNLASMDAFQPLTQYTDLIAQDDVLYDYVYEHYDQIFGVTTPEMWTGSTPLSPPSFPAGTSKPQSSTSSTTTTSNSQSSASSTTTTSNPQSSASSSTTTSNPQSSTYSSTTTSNPQSSTSSTTTTSNPQSSTYSTSSTRNPKSSTFIPASTSNPQSSTSSTTTISKPQSSTSSTTSTGNPESPLPFPASTGNPESPLPFPASTGNPESPLPFPTGTGNPESPLPFPASTGNPPPPPPGGTGNPSPPPPGGTGNPPPPGGTGNPPPPPPGGTGNPEPPFPPTGSGARKKREAVSGHSSSRSGMMGEFLYRPQHGHQPTDHSVEEAEDALREIRWSQLEKEIFVEESLNSERHRRSASSSSEALAALRAFQFNKWDALDGDSTNLSYYETRGAEYRAAMAYAYLSGHLPANRVQRSGHRLKDMLLSCSFAGYPCSPRNFSYFHNHKFGNCYTFNSPESTSETLYTMFPGPEHGLTLEFYLQQEEYVPALAAEAGIRAVIHPKGTAVFPEDEGVSVQPAHSISVGLAMDRVERLGPPHGTCDDSRLEEDLYAVHLNLSYSKLSCLKSCYQAIVQTHCNCSLPMYYVTDPDNVCDVRRERIDKCTSSLPERVPEEYSHCDTKCPQPCSATHYRMTVSAAAWPSDAYEEYLETKIIQSNYLLMGGETDGFATAAYHVGRDDNFAKLNVYFMDLIYTKMEQQKAYESQNLISDIGGQLGLWLGLSAITLGELCGLMLSIFRSLMAKGTREKRVRNDPVKPFTTTLQMEQDDTA